MMNWKNHPRNWQSSSSWRKKNERVVSPRKKKLRSNLWNKKESSPHQRRNCQTHSLNWWKYKDGEGGKKPPSLKSFTHILQWWNLVRLNLTQIRSKKYMKHVIHSLRSANISIFYRKSENLAISSNTDIDCILIHNFYLF